MGTGVELINGWILPVLAGPVVGSFLGVLIRRLPAGRDVVVTRSACEVCGHGLTPSELVPILSYLRQRGRCAACAARIDPAHLWIELAALAVPIIAACAVPGGPFLWLSCVLGWWLLALAWIDAVSFRLPDVLTLPIILAGLAEAGWFEPASVIDRAVGATVGFGALWLIGFVYRRIRHREGLGLGDAKLLAAGGAWGGISLLPFTMFVAPALALLYAGILWLRGIPVTATTKLPFGPFLAGAIWMAWILQP
jgi:leader peptidase (prepilin peptidase)/N-methyltransferase